MISSELVDMVKQRLGGLKHPIKLIAFSSERQGPHGQHIAAFAQDIATAAPKVNVETYVVEQHPEKARQYHVDKVPALIIENNEKKQARFFGLPSGQEFNVFLGSLVDFSRGNMHLPEEIMQKAREITTPMHLQVFVSDTCPYCPGMVRLTHGMALANDLIRTDTIRIEEFRSLADKFQVMGVPHTVVNNKTSFRGAVPSDVFLKKLKEMEK